MKTAFALLVLALAGAALVFAGCAKEAGHEETAGQEHAMTAGEHNELMIKQHGAMVTTQKEWVKAKEAIEAGEAGEARAPLAEIGHAAEGIEGFMLHKNPDKRDEFLKKAREYKSLVMTLEQYAAKGDIKSLKEIAPEIDASCNGCHQSFR